MDYYSVDIETSGPVPGRYSLLSIGVTHVRREGARYAVFEDHYLELKPLYPEVSEPAMRVHGLDLAKLEATGHTAVLAMQSLVEFVARTQKQPEDRPVFVAHNAPFDWMFVAHYLDHAGLPNPFGHSAIDTKALSMGVLGLSWYETSLKQLSLRLPEVSPRDEALIHHAGADARYQAEVFVALMNRLRASRRGTLGR